MTALHPPEPTRLGSLTPAAAEGWHVLLDLAEADSENWLLVGGEMVVLLAAESGVEPPRATVDVDLIVDVRARPGGTEWLANWLVERDFEMQTPSALNIAPRFSRAARSSGSVRRPSLLAAIVAKAAATSIAARGNPERDWEDAAFLLTLVQDPLAARAELTSKDRKRLNRLRPLRDSAHYAWRRLDGPAATNGRDALLFLLA